MFIHMARVSLKLILKMYDHTLSDSLRLSFAIGTQFSITAKFTMDLWEAHELCACFKTWVPLLLGEVSAKIQGVQYLIKARQ